MAGGERRFVHGAARALAAGLVLVVAGAGCLGYGFSGRTRTGDVFIPFFGDETSGERSVDVGVQLTRRLVDEFQADRNTRVFQAQNDRALAQKELTGVVKRVTEQVNSRDPDQTGEEYRVVVVVSVTWRDLATDTVLWQSGAVTGDGNYLLEESQSGFDRALTEALDEVVHTITDNTLRAW